MSRRRAVIADDDPDIRGLIRISCGRADLDVVAEETDGAAAHRAIVRERPDLVILDVSMPELSGIEVCRLVRADDTFRDVRILLLSASVDDSTVEMGLRAGADDYLPKPFSPRQLVQTIADQFAEEPR